MSNSVDAAAARAVFVHGAGAGGWEWDIWRRVFAAHGWDCHAPDLMPAAIGLAATRLEDYVAQVRAWCAAGAPSPVLVGASLGGLLALLAAADVLPKALVLINPIVPAAFGTPAAQDCPAIIPWASARSLHGTQRALPDADAAAILLAWRRWRDESGAVVNAARAGVAAESPRCPTLVMASAHDDAAPAAASAAMAAAFGAEFMSLPHASHVGPLLGRSASACAAAALAWLSRASAWSRSIQIPFAQNLD